MDRHLTAVCCLLCALVGGNTIIRADAPAPAAYHKIAVIGSPSLQQSGLTDLVSMRLQNAGVQLIRRVKLEKLAEEQELSAALGAVSTPQRVKMGFIVGADALVLLNEEQVGENHNVRVIVAECKQGARLSSDLFSLNAPDEDLADKIAAAVARTRQRFAGGLKGMVGVPPFISRDFTYEFHPLQAGYATLLQEALADAPGVAVVEVAEAWAIRRELDIAGPPKAASIVPVFVEGKYEVISDAANPPRVRLKILIRTAENSRTIEKHDLTLEAASRFISRELTAEVLPDFRAGAARPFTADAEFASLTALADAFAALGEWQHAVALRQAALVIDPDSARQRAGVVDESVRLLAANTVEFGPLRNDLVANLLPQWQAALVSLEWEIRRNPNAIPASRISATLSAGLNLARGSTSADEAQRLKRDFLRHVFPLTWDRQSKATPAHPAWYWVDQPMRIAVDGERRALISSDYNILLDLLDEAVPPDDEPSKWFTDLLWSRHAAARMQRGSGDFSTFLHQLETARRPVNRIMAQVALVSRRVEQGEAIDAAALRQIEDLQADYVALGLTPIPVPHNGILEELARLRKSAAAVPAALRAAAAPAQLPVAVQWADGRPIIQSGVLQFEKLHLRQKRLDGSLIEATDGVPGSIRGISRIVRCGNELDVAWDQYCVNFIREPGLLETVWDMNSTPTFSDVKWDGWHIWIATLNDGLWVVDTAGNVRVKIKEGLKPSDQQLRLSVLGPDRIVVAGSFGPANRAWVAIVDKPAEAYHVSIIHETTRIVEPNYHVLTGTINDKDLAFAPGEIGICRSSDGKHESVVIRRDGFAVGRALLIDADNLAVTAPNSPLQFANFSVSGGRVVQILGRNEIALWRATGNGDLVQESTISLPCTTPESWRLVTPGFGPDSPIYAVGTGWYRIDPRKKSARRLCPDAPLGDFRLRGVTDSHLGLVMWGKSGGRYDSMYRVTVDEEKLNAMPD